MYDLDSFEKIDSRKPETYRFDLDNDIRWNQIDLYGQYFTMEYLKDIGVNTDVLEMNTPLAEELQKLFALSFCRTFIHLETEVVNFIKREYKELGISLSAFTLVEEEVKHTLLFQRYEKFLETQISPEVIEIFNENYHPPHVSTFEEISHVLKTKEQYHAFFWMSTVFFEEFTIHFFDKLKIEQKNIQPTWYDVHKFHRQEEIQHVLTDKVYFDSLNLSQSEKNKVSKFFLMYLELNFDKYLSLNSLRAFFGVELIPESKLKETGFYQELLHSKSFRVLRGIVPLLNEVLSGPIHNQVMNEKSYIIGEELDIKPPHRFSALDWLYDIANTDKLITFCRNTKGEIKSISYRELLDNARAKLGHLKTLGVRKGDVIVLFLDNPEEILPLFWGAIMGGIIPTIVAPPSGIGKGEEEYLRLKNICQTLRRPIVVHSLNTIEQSEGIHYLHVDDFSDESIYIEPTPSYDDELCFIQFSSGSTSRPKGIRISHTNLFYNIQAMRQARNGEMDNETFISWLPLYHDMGLIGYHLCPVGLRANQVLMRPSTFIRRPRLWAQMISQFQGTQTASPNFGLGVLLKDLSKTSEIFDLSSMKSFLVGAEPISNKHMQLFLSQMKKYSLSETSMCPAYGLAEATLGVTMLEPSKIASAKKFQRSSLYHQSGGNFDSTTDIIELVNCGKVIPGIELRIVDDSSNIVDQGVVGKIQIAGKSITSGFYNIDDSLVITRDHKWLDTGDLGLINDNEIYITGRFKDLLTSNGKNYYAHDLEELVKEKYPLFKNVYVVGVWDQEANEDNVIIFTQEAKSLDYDLLEVKNSINIATNLQVKHIFAVSKNYFSKTSSGKPQRYKLKEKYIAGEFDAVVNDSLVSRVKTSDVNPNSLKSTMETVKKIWSNILELDAGDIDENSEFQLLGGNSLKAVEIHHSIEEAFGKTFDLELLMEGTTISKMALYIDNCLPKNHKKEEIMTPPKFISKRSVGENDIAIIGTGLRIPGANTLDEFWRILSNGESKFTAPPAMRWGSKRIPDNVKCKVGSFLNDIDLFDAGHFSINEDEAKEIDPQQRIFLEVLLQAIEDSGVATKNIGIFASSGDNAYKDRILKQNHSSHHTLMASLKNMTAARASKVFDFKGPAMIVDTACSSSLVAVHEACKSLRVNECEVAIAGGVQLYLTPDVYSTFDKAGVLSKTGISAPFDQNASGLVPGEGCGVVVLKKLSKAIEDNDQILSVILGSSVNNDGASLNGTVPNPHGQKTAIETVYKTTNICPSSVGYVEAHAAGTMIGDTVEVGALNDVFGQVQDERTSTYIGSVKSNLGHALSASGILGLLKVIASLKYRMIPPTINCVQPSTRIDFSNKVFEPTQKLTQFPNRMNSPRAAINSLGLGGTNVHMLLEAFENSHNKLQKYREENLSYLKNYPIFLSAPSEKALYKLASVLKDPANQEDLMSVCKAFAQRGKYFNYRMAINSKNFENSLLTPVRKSKFKKMAFVFPGPGTQYHRMGEELYRTMPRFKETLDHCHRLLQEFNINLLDILYGKNTEEIHKIENAQIAVFSFGVSLAMWLKSIGVNPDVVAGHSAGEYAAAVISGVLSLEDALKIVMTRGQLMSESEKGSMLAVFTDEANMKQLLMEYKRVSIAAINESKQIVVSGCSFEIDSLIRKLDSFNIGYKKLEISCAAHSPLMLEAKQKLSVFLKDIPINKPKIDFYSSMESRSHDSFDSSYWADHLVNPVRFADTIQNLNKSGVDLILELGGTSSLTMAISRVCDIKCLTFFDKKNPDLDILIASLCELYEGHRLDFPERFYSNIESSVKALNYNLQDKKKLWHDDIERNFDSKDYFYGTESCITDHVANNNPIAPAAMLIDYILYKSNKNLSRFIIEKSFAIDVASNERRYLDLQEKNNSFVLASSNDSDSIEHVKGGFAKRSQNYQIINIEKMKSNFDRWYMPTEVYEVLENNGLKFGPSMQSIEVVGLKDNELFVELKTKDVNYQGYLIEPSLLDGALQSLAVFGLKSTENSDGFLGFSSNEIRFYGEVKDHCFAYVKLKTEFNSSSDIMRCDVKLFDRDGNILLEIDDFTAKRVSNKLDIFKPQGDVSMDSGEIVAIKFAPGYKSKLLDKMNQNYANAFKTESSFDESLKFTQSGVLKTNKTDSFDKVEIKDYIIDIISNKLSLDKSFINPNDSFQELGLDSIGAVSLVKEIETKYDIKLYPTVFFEYRTISLLSDYLKDQFSL